MRTSFLSVYAALASFTLPGVNAAASFSGSNLYYASGLKPAQQQILLEGLQSAGVKVLRVWLDGVAGTVKGTPVVSVPALEGDEPGAYRDTVLENLDDFMAVANGYGIKLLVSLYSYNALKANEDYYGKQYGIADFYTNPTAISQYKSRIAHIMSHVNPHNGKSWAQSSEYIFAFETQNEAMHDQENVKALEAWQCEIAGAIKDNLKGNSGILVTTGGGAVLSNSLLEPYFSCQALDLLAIHAYGVGDFATSALQPYVAKAKAAGKLLIMQEWGSCYTTASNNNCNGGSPLDATTREANIKKWTASIAAAGIPSFYWQILPNEDPHQGWDYEVGIGGQSWDTLKAASLSASQSDAAFDFGPWLLGRSNSTATATVPASGPSTTLASSSAASTVQLSTSSPPSPTSPSTTLPASAPTQTSDNDCEWPGHCTGATCGCDDDCSGSLICSSGTCSQD